jgi:hypothetical protein
MPITSMEMNRMSMTKRLMRSKLSLTGARLAFGIWFATSLWAADLSFTTGTPDGRLEALSAYQPRETRDGDGR